VGRLQSKVAEMKLSDSQVNLYTNVTVGASTTFTKTATTNYTGTIFFAGNPYFIDAADFNNDGYLDYATKVSIKMNYSEDVFE
jgi:hypothetical protein